MEGIRLSGERRCLRLASDNPASFNERNRMRRTPRSLADPREELVQIEQEFVRLQKRIEAVRDCVTDSLVSFGRTLSRRPILLRHQEATELQT